MAQKFTTPRFAAPRAGGADELAINQAHDGITALTEGVNNQPHVAADGSLVTQEFPAATTVRVKHKLGRLPTGWLVLRVKDATCQVYETSSDANFTTLVNPGSTCTLTLWFF